MPTFQKIYENLCNPADRETEQTNQRKSWFPRQTQLETKWIKQRTRETDPWYQHNELHIMYTELYLWQALSWRKQSVALTGRNTTGPL